MERGMILAAVFGCIAALTPADQVPDLVGVWGVEGTFGPDVSGALVLDARGDEWYAEIAGLSVPVGRRGGHVSFELPEDLGAFRGDMEVSGREIVGQWIQPPGRITGTRYATPVVLTPVAEEVWRGEVSPLRDAFSLYLAITRDANGGLEAAFRNPEFNFGRGGPWSAALVGEQVTLTGASEDPLVFHARWDRERDVLEMPFEPLGGLVLTFTRRARGTARGFHPHTPTPGAWTYRPPMPLDDGWETATLEEVGLRRAPLGQLVDSLARMPYAGFRTPYVHSLLVARHGKLALEEYFHGFDRTRPHDMRSASKTFAGTMVGLARSAGAPVDLDAPILRSFPEYDSLAHVDDAKRSITLSHLLTMTSGLACDDNDDSTPGHEDVMQSQGESDWYRYTLDLPMARPPGGEQAVYCTAGVNLVGGALRNALGRPLPEFFFERFARPLDIAHYHVNLLPTGAAYAGGGVYMRPRDQLKLGQLYLDGGVWRGRQVLPSAWVEESLLRRSSFGPDHGYGYTWHVIDLESGGEQYRIFEAGGNGGQFVLFIPQLDVAIGITAGNYGDYGTWYRFLTEFVPRYLIPAARSVP